MSESGTPESALVGFSETDSFQLLIGTGVQSRKFQNIVRGGRVSVVIGWDENITVQYEGLARPLHNDEKGYLLENHYAKLPDLQQCLFSPILELKANTLV